MNVYPSIELEAIFRAHPISTVLHFAAATVVAESVQNPAKYYRNNVAGTVNLVQCAASAGVKHFVLSSTAAVYGTPVNGVCDEQAPTNPINPYGRSKLMSETILKDVCSAALMEYVILRYFNVAGADSEGGLGQRGRVSTHLTKIACEVAVGLRDFVPIFGTDYQTKDGTCIRDYIHIEDLADAHLAAVNHLRLGRDSIVLNCGYGHGFSVLDIFHAVQAAAGKPLEFKAMNRRPGDPPILIAKSDRIRKVLHWKPKLDNLELIAKSALAWERKLLEERAGPQRPEGGLRVS